MTRRNASTPAEAGVVPFPDRMTGAELRVVREFLGLTTRWLADHLEVAERSVHRWESDVTPIPDGVRRQVEAWEDDTARTIDLAVAQLMDAAEPGVATYRTDADYLEHEPGGGWSASWHRSMVARVAQEVPGLTIVYR